MNFGHHHGVAGTQPHPITTGTEHHQGILPGGCYGPPHNWPTTWHHHQNPSTGPTTIGKPFNINHHDTNGSGFQPCSLK